jgi:hypothetical protein
MKMKKLFGASLLAVSVGGALQAKAVSTDLTVNGEISSGTCNIALTNASVDLGDISNASVTANGLVLPEKQVPVSIDCESPTYLAIDIKDNRGGTAYPDTIQGSPDLAGGLPTSKLGLNLDQSGNPIGYWLISVHGGLTAPIVNNAPGNTLYSRRTTPYNWLQGVQKHLDWGRNVYTFTEPGSTTSPVTSVKLTFGIEAFLAPRTSLDMTREINPDGSATIELLYL